MAADIHADDSEIKSKEMMQLLAREYDHWRIEKSAPEENALDGIQKLMQINLSHPIKDGLFLIYFVKKIRY